MTRYWPRVTWSAFCNDCGTGCRSRSGPERIPVAWAGSGRSATFGWYNSPRMEALRNAWLEADGLDAQKRICRDMQVLAFDEVPFYPIGTFSQQTAMRANLTGLVRGAPVFWGIRRV